MGDAQPRRDVANDAPAARGKPRDRARPVVARAGMIRVVPVLLTLTAVVVACLLGWVVWDVYVVGPWTRDGAVRAYVVTATSEVAGRLTSLPVQADQYVHKGDLLMQIDPTNYQIAVGSAEAAVVVATSNRDDKRLEAERREKLSTLSTSVEERESYNTSARAADAQLQQSLAQLAQARVNLGRTRITSPVNGYVTNLTVQAGDYLMVGERAISIIDADSFWVDGYFEETQLGGIAVGDKARVVLMGYRTPLAGHVAGITHGIQVANAQPGAGGLAAVNPVFTWIRLSQRIPVRVALDQVPPDVTLIAGMTATVQVAPGSGHGPPLLRRLLP